MLAVAVWLALVFQRHLLLGAVARESGARQWRRYGLYLLAMASLGIVFAVLWGIMFSLVLPGIALFLMVLNSSAPWLAVGAVILGVLAFTVAAYLPARLALILPALAADHDPGFGRTWRLTKGNGLRLLALLVVIPGVLHGLRDFALSEGDGVLSVIIPGVVLGSYLFLVDLGILAFAYRALSDQALPVVSSGGPSAWFGLGARYAAPVAVVVLTGLIGAGLWDAVYRVEPDEVVRITRLGKPERIETEPGIKFKIPGFEEAHPILETAGHYGEGDGHFLTASKDSVSLQYRIDWRVTDVKAYARTLAGEARRGNHYIQRLAEKMLRYRLAGLSLEEVRRLVDAGDAERSVDDEPRPDALLGDGLQEVNARTKELGIEITRWRVELMAQPAT